MNALKELQFVLDKPDNIKCISLSYGDAEYILKVNHNTEEFDEFCKSIDFEYDAGYGCQELFGIVLLNDGSWLDRHEYDGSEGWTHQSYPGIPEECIDYSDAT